MRCVWVSPEGAHVETALRIQAAGHAVVTYGHGASGLPAVPKLGLADAARVADLVVVDGPYPLTRNGRSWKPSLDSLFWDELRRHYQVVALGPTPTVDLLVGDRRYLRKMCARFGVPYDLAAQGSAWSSGAWFSATGAVPPGPFLDPFVSLFKSVGFRGWFALHGVLTADGPVVQAASAEWAADTVPEGREAEWLQALAEK